MLQALHDYLEGRLPEAEFQATADDAVRLTVDAQATAGVDVVTDGEQRRDNYASFLAARLDNCQLVPITDLLPYVEDPAEFEKELRALDVPAGKVRHPAPRRQVLAHRRLGRVDLEKLALPQRVDVLADQQQQAAPAVEPTAVEARGGNVGEIRGAHGGLP